MNFLHKNHGLNILNHEIFNKKSIKGDERVEFTKWHQVVSGSPAKCFIWLTVLGIDIKTGAGGRFLGFGCQTSDTICPDHCIVLVFQCGVSTIDIYGVHIFS